MNWLAGWRERRTKAENVRWFHAHRWDALATYNSEVSRGIVHTAEYDEVMRQEQTAWAAERHGGSVR